jgi:predicted negative regulator of RcsB-dependent stress response
METDEEQVEKLKKWWNENGRAVIAGVIIGVGGLFGYRYWIDLQETTAASASMHFTEMVKALESNDSDNIVVQAETLISDYADSEYATLARFALARNFVANEDYDKAQQQLELIIGSVGDSPLGFLARKRLAAVQLQQAQPDRALATLSIDFPPAFNAEVEELKGDIYASQGNLSDAVNAYRKAQGGDPAPANGQFIQQKIDDLGSAG